jgi:hypothetical protein
VAIARPGALCQTKENIMRLTRLLLASAFVATLGAMSVNIPLAQTSGGQQQPPVNAESFSQDD